MKRNILLALAIVLTGSVMAQSKMDAYSKITLEGMRHDKAAFAKNMAKASSTGENAVKAFITVKNEAAMDKLRQMGVELGYGNGHITTATIPMSVIDSVLEMDDVTNLNLSRTLSLHNDFGRSFCHVDEVHNGEGLDRPYKGKGVIYGTVDQGIDFNHAAFKDENGQSRVLMAYLPDDKEPQTGAMENYTVSLDGYTATLNGYVYDTNNLSELRTGVTETFHGTHTANTGAGSAYGSQRYYGMAPEASLILVDAAQLSNVNVINGIALVFSEAQKLGMPAVVNLSIGGNYGPHTVTPYTEMLNSLTGPGRIICLSAGNEGSSNLWLHKPADETVKTRVVLPHSDEQHPIQSLVDIWGNGGKLFTMKIYARNVRTNELHELYNTDEGEPEVTIEESEYFKMGALNAGIQNDQGEYNTIMVFVGLVMQDDYELVLELSGECEADAWGNHGMVTFAGEEGTDYVAGSPDNSLNTTACFDNAISVGSYTSNRTFVWAGDGNRYAFSEALYPVGKVTSFSSYGTDRLGRVVPTVLAPGAWISSAANIYCSDSRLTDTPNDMVVEYNEKDGRIQPYQTDLGTSMAAPAVSGIIALWLEQNPTLTPQDVKNILAITSVKDEYLEGDEKRAGFGKINALAGMQKVPTEIINKVKGKEPMITSARNGFSVLSPKADAKVEVFNAAGQCVMSAMAKGGKTQQFTIEDRGMFIVKVGAAVKKIML